MHGFASPTHQSQAALVQALVRDERITSQRVAAAMAALDRRHFLNPDDPELFASAYVVRRHSASCLFCCLSPKPDTCSWSTLERAVLLHPGPFCGSNMLLGLACTPCAPETLSAGQSVPMLLCTPPGGLKSSLQHDAASLLEGAPPLLSCAPPPASGTQTCGPQWEGSCQPCKARR